MSKTTNWILTIIGFLIAFFPVGDANHPFLRIVPLLLVIGWVIYSRKSKEGPSGTGSFSIYRVLITVAVIIGLLAVLMFFALR